MLDIFLDTNSYSALVRGDERVLRAVREATRVAMSPIVVGELITGFRGGNRQKKNREILKRFLAEYRVSTPPVTEQTAELFAEILSTLRARGLPIPTNDIWIAAQALEARAALVSFDRHFERIGALRWVDPAS